ncbi:glycosyltransferase [Anabaena cylindrica FACHB-243]|uniref:Glycosyl transferase family 2 n=1 Tax=Anabaena cylindrica (strain ATCC 27899 / PCC 7122) TaxID=272123 RepID=K9ZCI4_ANACC|nr:MULTISPECIES: glycosyltransferase [Anabaena]AFZ56434.1 glycosyl transferase family 2 [Anabaena cylindrica PCC 7122]MBD2418115.1 glycosyltransferase [Anabaena cylindrica FACHB-243]MBY5281961.1 glycosyltransferase [Anabaena sp. CCAP 1446/1C]MBY5311234.1 glycosyltransferase [Anabaena sp. CCAP 1446/1C]MCM2407393.1 glycosyltransferase [Anabaena sp. CCAP 1446/1C]
MELISVIIPVYNGGKTIKPTIESVLKQAHYNFEIIVINSDSIDSTLEIVSSIQDQRIKIYNYPKANAAVNRNRGLKHACGELITFLDADDIWTSDKLEAQYRVLQENSQATVVYSWTDAIDELGKLLRPCSHSTWQGDVYAKLLLDDFIGSGSNAMIRSFAFDKVGGFDETLTNAEDTDMWLRLAAQYHFIFVPQVQIFYRISSNSKSSNILGLEISNLRIIEKEFATAPLSLQYLKPYRIANLYKYLSYKALTVSPGKQNSIQATRILWLTLINDTTLLQKPIIYKALLKLMIMTLLPPQQAMLLLNKFPKLSNISTFFGYIKTNVPATESSS